MLVFYTHEKQNNCQAGGSHLIILATQEAEIREDHNLKPAWANSSRDPYLKKKKKKKITKKEAGGMFQGVGPEFKPQYCKKKKKRKENLCEKSNWLISSCFLFPTPFTMFL
jgi:hypothetical protein